MAFVPILVAVDGATLAAQVADGKLAPGTASAPTSLGSLSESNVYLTMTCRSSFVSNQLQGSSELSVTCRWGDVLTWTIRTFDGNTDYTAYLYAGRFSRPWVITPLVFLHATATCYLPPTSDPLSPPKSVQDATYLALGAAVRSSRRFRYTLSFALVQNSTGALLGHFTWDPFLTVLLPTGEPEQAQAGTGQ